MGAWEVFWTLLWWPVEIAAWVLAGRHGLIPRKHFLYVLLETAALWWNREHIAFLLYET